MTSYFEYPITRPFTLRYFSPIIVMIGVIWVASVTVINIAVVGYESVPVFSTSFNSSTELWYERVFLGVFWIPRARNCVGSTIKGNEDISTENNIFNYNLRGFIDPRVDNPVDGMIYSNNALHNCSVKMLQFSQSASAAAEQQVIVACNTSAQQYLVAKSWRTEPNTLSTNYLLSAKFGLNSDISHARNLLGVWVAIENLILQLLAPIGERSLLLPSLGLNDLSMLQLSYYETQDQIINTPANDYWALTIEYVRNNEFQKNSLSLTFLPTGELDHTHTPSADLAMANALFGPTISYLQSQIGGTVDFWRLIGSLFFSFYWTYLFDLGVISPTIYAPSSDFPDSRYQVNFLQANAYLPTNNLFVNATLLNLYESFFRNSILPYFNSSLPELTPPLGVDRFMENATFLRSYSCVQRQLKAPGSLIISVIVADYALIVGAYNLVILFAGMIEKRRRSNGDAHSTLGLHVVSYCLGCILLKENLSAQGFESGEFPIGVESETVPLSYWSRQ